MGWGGCDEVEWVNWSGVQEPLELFLIWEPLELFLIWESLELFL